MSRHPTSTQPGARAIAAQVIQKLLEKEQTLTALLPAYLCRLTNKKDQALTQELCFGVMRWYFQLDFLLGLLMEKKIKTKDTDIKALLLVGLYQFVHLRTPPHAVVAATVEACHELNKLWAKGLVNAVLRRFQRESKYLLEKIRDNDVARYSHPQWLLEVLKKNYPEGWTAIVAANNTYPPMALRVNTGRIERQAYLTMLHGIGIGATPAPDFIPAGIILERPVDVEKLPHFNDGYVSVQDLAAQLAPSLLDLQPSQRLLDACAAPGGKLAHIIESEPGLQEVTGVEHDPARFERLQRTLARLHLKAKLIYADARKTADWWDGRVFDRILLDAPCSASGVIRRHPDIKVLRTVADIEAVMTAQRELLSALWPLLKTGGRLLYVTCSILDSENDQQIGEFLRDHTNARVIVINADWGVPTHHGRQILPGQNNMDGFYYACLQKIQ
jgi:16S rRNA (cytosine967-C5)-methyltransferase